MALLPRVTATAAYRVTGTPPSVVRAGGMLGVRDVDVSGEGAAERRQDEGGEHFARYVMTEGSGNWGTDIVFSSILLTTSMAHSSMS